jgi:lysophospholipase L1-like esterase
MKKAFFISVCVIFVLSSVCFCSTDDNGTSPWLGIHLYAITNDKVEQLTEAVEAIARLGINAVVVEINYGYEYQSHPELRSPNASGKEQVQKLVAQCRKYNVRLIPQFQCLGHQSWKGNTFPLLTEYPQFDETPGEYPGNDGIYCRSWCPLHPDVNPIIFELMDELIEVFEADALHVGMDETFLIAEDSCSRCKGKSKAQLFAKAINDYHEHIVGKRKIEMLMWGDRLIDASKIKYGEWEASANNTAGAVDLIPKDIIICDWHYEQRDSYESIPMFLEKGFRVWPASWRKPEAAKALIEYSVRHKNPRMVGHLNTTWGAVQMNELTTFAPLRYSTGTFMARPETYLEEVKELMRQKWPDNRTINIVCHGHSVPSGYFKTPIVDTFNAYPHLLHQVLKAKYPHAVINVIVTAIGGETSDKGEERFREDVLSHRPDVVTIDYGLNDRRIGLENAEKSLTSMIKQAKEQGIKVVLLTPTADVRSNLNEPEDPLNKQAELIRRLAESYNVGLVDSLAEFKAYVSDGGQLKDLMSQDNHPNRKGHDLVAEAVIKWF